MNSEIHYYLHPTYRICTTCEITDENPDSIYIKESPLLGDSIVFDADTYSFYGLDLVLKPQLQLGATYTFSFAGSEEITATITESNEMIIFGETDSLKTFSFSNEKEIILSKNHGVISVTLSGTAAENLVGIPELQAGNYFPGIRDFYDFEVGDVFMYIGSYGEDEPYWYDRMTRVELTQVNYASDALTITFNNATRKTSSILKTAIRIATPLII